MQFPRLRSNHFKVFNSIFYYELPPEKFKNSFKILEEMTEEEIVQMMKLDGNNFLPSGGPLFEIKLVPSGEKTYILYKVNHVVHDGHSALRFFCTLQDGGREAYLENNIERKRGNFEMSFGEKLGKLEEVGKYFDDFEKDHEGRSTCVKKEALPKGFDQGFFVGKQLDLGLLVNKAKSIKVSVNDLLLGICANVIGKLGKGEDMGHKFGISMPVGLHKSNEIELNPPKLYNNISFF